MKARWFTPLVAIAFLLLTPAAQAIQPPSVVSEAVPRPEKAVDVRFTLFKTSEVKTQEGFAFDGGDLFKSVTANHTAVLVQHPRGSFLFDTALGRDIDQQYRYDMPWWAKPLFSYGPVKPLRDQMDAAQLGPVDRIILSHAHWDHASGLKDFPRAEVWITKAEKDFIAQRHPGAVLPSQVDAPDLNWKVYDFENRPFASFARSRDVFGDGSVVLVPLSGHTPGSVGLFLTVKSGKQYFLCGDVVWRLEAAQRIKPKFWVPSRIVDNDRPATLHSVEHLHRLMLANPALIVVPTHDAAVQDALGYFPHWVD
jgi:Zn-dependent hydrolases, including glyoxylases